MNDVATDVNIDDSFDIDALDDGIRENVQKLIETSESGLKKNNHELKGQLTNVKKQARAAADQLAAIQEKLGDHSLDDISAMVERTKALEQGEYEKAMSNEEIKKIVDPVLSRERATNQKELAKATGALQAQIDELTTERNSLKESVMKMSFDKRSADIFTGLPNHDASATELVADQVRKYFTPDKSGQPEAIDEFGDIRVNPKGEAWSLEWFIEDWLPNKYPLFFKQPEGGGAQGSSGGGRSIDYGLGITSRLGVSDELRNQHMDISRKRGVNPSEAWNKIPMFPNGQVPT